MANFDYRKFLKENKSTFFSSLTEGQFSWMTQDTDNQIGSEPENTITVYMHDNKGNTWREDNYEGYGEFGGMDYYELLAKMNGYTEDDIERLSNSNVISFPELRNIGVKVAFGDLKPLTAGPVLFPALTENPRYPSGHDFTEEAKNDPNQSWYNREDDDYNDWEDDDDDSWEPKYDEDGDEILFEAQGDKFDVETTRKIAQKVADAFTADDDLDLKYVVSPDVEESSFNLDVEAGPNTPGEDWKDVNGFSIDNYLGKYAGGSFYIKDGVVINAAARGAKVANVSPEGEVEMISAEDSRADLDAKEKANVFVREETKSNKMKLNEDTLEVKQMSKLIWQFFSKKGWSVSYGKYTQGVGKTIDTKGGDQKRTVEIQLDPAGHTCQVAFTAFAAGADLYDGDYDKAKQELGFPDSWFQNPKVNQHVTKIGQELENLLKSKYPKWRYGFDQDNKNQAYMMLFTDEAPVKETESNKMKKSELKEMIKAAMLAEYEKDVNVTDENPENEEDFLAETQNSEVLAMADMIMDALGAEKFVDELISAMSTDEAKANLEHIIQMWDLDGGLYEAKDEEVDVEAAAEETETDSEETTDVAVDSEETIDTETTAEVNPDTKVVQDALTQAMEAAKKLGDKKLEAQIGNTITFFTRAHIAGTELDAVAENTKEYYKDAEADDAEHIDALEKDMADDKKDSLKIGEVMFPMWNKLNK